MSSASCIENSCLQWNTPAKVGYVIGIVAATVTIAIGILTLLAANGYHLGAINAIGQSGNVGVGFL